MPLRLTSLALSCLCASLSWGASAWAQNVRVDTDPPRATLVCDGVVVGITPTAFDPSTKRTCTLFAAGHANLSFDPSELSGVVARFRLTPVEAPNATPASPPPQPTPAATHAVRRCGYLDTNTGLLVPCFGGANESRVPPERTHAATRGGRRCGYLDPRTHLLVPCFDPPPRRRASRTERPPAGSAQRPPERRCGHLDPRTQLLVPCF